MKSEIIKQVVVRGTNWVGDALMSVPALRELRRVLPAARITLCTRPNLALIFADADFLDDVLIYEGRGAAAVFRQAAKWRERRFDLAVLLPNSFEAALLATFGAARRRVGYRTDGRGLLLTDAVPVPAWKSERHEVFYYLNLVAELEIRLSGSTEIWEREPDASLNVSEARRTAARETLAEAGADLSKKIIALCAGSTNSRAKRWGAANFARLADLIADKLNANAVLIGAPDELAVSRAVVNEAQAKPVLLTGKTNLAELCAVLSVSDLLVTNDTGPAHIAPAVGTRAVVIFGPTVPATTRPFSDRAEIVSKPPVCAPCMLRDCPIDHRCMTAIAPEDVFERVKMQMESN